MPWYNQRIPGKLHDPARGVHITLKPHGTPNDQGWKEEFIRSLRSSHFAFVVGGGGIDTFRFLEVLSMGCIPVVFSDLILPFEFSIISNWDSCVVRLPFTELEDIVQNLEAITCGWTSRRAK